MATGYNSTNYSTKDIQSKLGITADNQYGSQTTQAVKNWQAQNGLTADGIFGQQSLAKWNSIYGSGTTPQAGTTVNANQLNSTQPFNIPTAPTYDNMTNELTNSIMGYTADQTKQENDQNTAQTDYMSYLKQLEGVTADTQQAENAQGLPQLSSDLRDLQAMSQQQTARYLQGYTQAEGQVVPLDVIRNRQQEMTRQHGIDALITNANISAKQGNIATAQAQVDRAIQLKYDPIKQKIQNTMDFLQMNYQNLSRTDKKLADAKQEKLQIQMKQIEGKKEQEKQIFDIMATISANYAPASVISAVKNAKSPEDALLLGAKYMSDPYDRQMKVAQIAKLNADASESKSTKNLLSKISALDPTSATYTQDLVKASAGGKLLTGEQATPFTKAITSLNQVGNLSALFNSTNTGPIAGLIRSFNPYDKDAQLIKGQIQSTLANLARSYGETGVLTDADIARYAGTLGKLTNPKEINQALVAMTLRSLSYGLEANLQSNAAVGRDVSGFSGILSNFNSKIAEIDSSIGVGNEDVNNYLDSSLTPQPQSSGGIVGWLNKWIYGK